MIITVTSNKGGVGKTTTAIHIAAFLAQEYGQGSTVVVDTDPNGSALDWASRAEQAGRPLPFGVVGPDDSAGEEEHTVFDSPGRLYGEELEQMATVSDLVVVPTSPVRLSVDVLAGFVGDFEEVSPEASYRVLLTMVPWWNWRGRQARSELDSVGVPLFKNHVRFRPAFDSAADSGLLVGEVKSRGARQGWEDYEMVCAEILEIPEVRSE